LVRKSSRGVLPHNIEFKKRLLLWTPREPIGQQIAAEQAKNKTATALAETIQTIGESIAWFCLTLATQGTLILGVWPIMAEAMVGCYANGL
jgi:nitrate reductase NapE component